MNNNANKNVNSSNQKTNEKIKTKEENLDKKNENKSENSKKDFKITFEPTNVAEEFLKKPRSEAYLEALSVMDVLSSTDEMIIEELKKNMDKEVLEEFEEILESFEDMTKEEIEEEIRRAFEHEFSNLTKYEEVEVEKEEELEKTPVLKGVLSKCYLSSCDCHSIDSQGRILEHYNIWKKLDRELEEGRKILKCHPRCMCVEIYEDCYRVVKYDGSIKKIPKK